MKYFHKEYPVEVVSTGLPYLLVPLRENLDKAKIRIPDFEEFLSQFGAKFVYVGFLKKKKYSYRERYYSSGWENYLSNHFNFLTRIPISGHIAVKAINLVKPEGVGKCMNFNERMH